MEVTTFHESVGNSDKENNHEENEPTAEGCPSIPAAEIEATTAIKPVLQRRLSRWISHTPLLNYFINRLLRLVVSRRGVSSLLTSYMHITIITFSSLISHKQII
mmetsp:Transcript_22847/g.40979  ORF Transcript_22847/g.40979 Transcript_22847/m.40979 type:complete len:104 (+) Transcript_22847:925-1236(+)